ncbi:hypothetical protein B7494_g7062 [Chlorociboria aeruginascens]|nr:hypothetical protein B7494_g7062 [Chlorociboria aeruginascens]
MPKHRTKPLKSKAEKCQTLGHSIFKNYGITKPPLRSSAKANPKSKPKSNRFTSITQTSNSLLAKFGYLDKRSAHLQSLESLELNLSERSNILALQRTCDSLSDLLSTYCTPVQNIEPEREIFRLDFGSTIHLLKVISTISRVKNRHRTAGCVLIKGDMNPKLTALSGWKNNEEAICEGLLDSSVWTEAVIRFCALIGHELPANMGDKKRKGEFNACHVEKQLALGFVCHAIYDENGGVDQQKLHELRTLNPKLQVEIHVSLDPCHNCLDFVQKLGRISGIDFEVLTIRDVVEVEKAKNDNGVRTEVRLLTQKRRREKEKKKLRKGMLRERRELMKAMADRTVGILYLHF